MHKLLASSLHREYRELIHPWHKWLLPRKLNCLGMHFVFDGTVVTTCSFPSCAPDKTKYHFFVSHSSIRIYCIVTISIQMFYGKLDHNGAMCTLRLRQGAQLQPYQLVSANYKQLQDHWSRMTSYSLYRSCNAQWTPGIRSVTWVRP